MRSVAMILRTLVTWPIMVFVTGVAAIAAILVALRNPASPVVERIIKLWSGAGVKLAGVRMTVQGAERLDPGGSYVVVANHISIIDIFAHFRGLPVPIRFLAKKELFRIPILGTALRAIGVVEVDRKAGAAALDTMNVQARQAIARGHSLIVYPEGTRSRDGDLQHFKKGAFAIGISTGRPIVPTTIWGTREVMKADSWWIRGGEVTLVIDEPIPTKGLTRLDSNALRDQTREVIAKRYTELREQSSELVTDD